MPISTNREKSKLRKRLPEKYLFKCLEEAKRRGKKDLINHYNGLLRILYES